MTGARTHRTALLSLWLCVLAVASCRTTNESNTYDGPKTDTVVSTTPPFKTKEPERYSATRTITIVAPTGEIAITTTSIARDGSMRREELETASTKVVYLELPAGRFILLPGQKVYAAATSDEAAANSNANETDENSPDRLLHTDPISTTYQAAGAETVAGRSTAKYRIVVNNSAAENVSPNETLMWIDNELNMPIKSETKSPDGTRSVMQLSDVSLDPDKQLFQIPAGYEKIAFSSLQKQLRALRLNP
jgi:outer membrane lipoprotein-sorting protein